MKDIPKGALRRFEAAGEVRKGEVFSCVELLNLPPIERAGKLDAYKRLGFPAWFNTNNMRGAKQLGFVTFEPLRSPAGVIVHRMGPGDVFVTDPTNEVFVVVITDLGRQLIKANPVTLS